MKHRHDTLCRAYEAHRQRIAVEAERTYCSHVCTAGVIVIGDDVDTIKLRAAIQSDASAIGALHVGAGRETYPGILPDEMLAELSVATRAMMWSNVLGDLEAFNAASVVVAKEGGDLVGFGSCARQRNRALAEKGFSGEIGAIYVLRSHQHQGIGRALMSALCRQLLAAGHIAVSLWVLRENIPARAFYDGLGGEIIGEKMDEPPDGTLVELAYGWSDLSGLIRLLS